MLKEINGTNKITGLKQSVKAVKAGLAAKAFVAEDADPYVTEPFVAICQEKGVTVEYCISRAELGHVCGIEVNAAVAVLIK